MIGLLSSFLNSISERYDVRFDTKTFVSYEQMETALENGDIDTMFPVYGSYWIAEDNSELNEKAFIDFATGLPNKNKCEEMLSSPYALSTPTACFMLDRNDLKLVNDTLGHEMGDLMILNFAKLLRQTVPLKFFVGRFGGDEFIVIAENIRDQEEAEHLLEKIQEMVLNFNSGNGKFKLNYACGYAFSKEFPSCNMMELLNVADQRMYEDKKKRKGIESE